MVNVSRLRNWFAAATILVILVVAGFYFAARYRSSFRHITKDVPKNLGVDIQQSTESFSLSKSEGGRTLFTIKASKAVQFKQGGHAELKNVSIVVYGKDSSRFDQIYGDDFSYNPQTGDVVAKGVVHIDLEANPQPDIHPELGPPGELKNPIHLKTSGLTFNQKTGLAKTDETVEFSIPKASGSARGAYYDAKTNAVTLGSDIRLKMTGPDATTVAAAHGVITKDPRRAVLDDVTLQRAEDTMTARKATVFLREDNSLERILAEGDVRTQMNGETGLKTVAPRAEFLMGPQNNIKSAVMTGGVAFEASGANQITGKAGRAVAEFTPDAHVKVIHTSDGVKILQQGSSVGAPTAAKSNRNQQAPKSQNNVELSAAALDLFVKNGKVLDRAETIGSGQISIVPQGTPTTNNGPTVVTAAKFTASFNGNRLSGMHGAPDARVVQSTPGQPDRVSTSDRLDATFDKAGAITGFVQQGNFKYREGQPGDKANRSASAEKATYQTATQMLQLEGSPRVSDGGMATSAQSIRLNRVSGDAEAVGSVKTTYSELSPQPNGALLASSDPVHVTAGKMLFTRSNGVAHYSGDARLWQGANIIEAPSINFSRDQRSMEAQGTASKRVATLLVQQGKNGTLTPVNITSSKLTYTDQQRQAFFQGGVVVRSADGTVTADHVTAYLKAADAARKKSTSATPSELDRIVAEGNIVAQQPNRRGTGDKLVYTADSGKFVLSGGPPKIVDAQQGTVTGASLTFYSGDDRVLVEGEGKSRAVTTTRVSK